MCRLLGYAGNPGGFEAEKWIFSRRGLAPFSRRTLVERQGEPGHPDGWGFARRVEGKLEHFRESTPLVESVQARKIIGDRPGAPAIFHIRRASVGVVEVRNCHPFVHESFAFAHNGSVSRDDVTKVRESLLDDPWRHRLKGDTDSEVIFSFLLQNIELYGEVRKAIKKVVQSLVDFTALNFLLLEGNTLHGYRHFCQREGYYTLFHALIANGGGHLLSSEPLGDAEWTPLSNREYVKIGPAGIERHGL